jgi:hypothetical protein
LTPRIAASTAEVWFTSLYQALAKERKLIAKEKALVYVGVSVQDAARVITRRTERKQRPGRCEHDPPSL